MRNDFDWLDLMRGITEMHVKSLALPDSPVSGNEGVGDCGKLPPGAEAAETSAFEHRLTTSPLRNEHSPDSQKFAGEQGLPQGTAKCGAATSPNSPAIHIDRFGDDRFTDNILRALEGLPQHGDDEEERDAAEEGALIEASGYLDPASDRRFA